MTIVDTDAVTPTMTTTEKDIVEQYLNGLDSGASDGHSERTQSFVSHFKHTHAHTQRYLRLQSTRCAPF